MGREWYRWVLRSWNPNRILCILIESWVLCLKMQFTAWESAFASLNLYAAYRVEVQPQSWNRHNVYVSVTPDLPDNRNMATITLFTITLLSFSAPSLIATRSSPSPICISFIPFSTCWHFTIVLLTIPVDTTSAESEGTQRESYVKSNPLMSSEGVRSWLYPELEQLLNMITAFLFIVILRMWQLV